MGYYCNECHDDISKGEFEYSMDHYGRALCMECQEDEEDIKRKKKRQGQWKKAPESKATPEAQKLYKALLKRSIKCRLESNDGFKTVDIDIYWADLHIEVDGKQHIFNPKQAYADMERAEYSSYEGIYTMRVPNDAIRKNVNAVADSIAQVARRRRRDMY
jgi:very-short-patch-repair endonuclease